MSLAAGSAFGPYRIIEPLGRGGMAAVYKAYEPALDRYVAVKVLPAEFLHDPTFAEKFRREAKVVARLEHPNIIPIYAFDIENGMPWMAMRLIAGGSLSAVVKGGRMGLHRAVVILRGVAHALDYAHAKGVVHRDVKPHNVLLDEAERVYLADFGIARMVEGSAALTQTGMITGTPQYMAPEQATARNLDHRADIYALGIVAYEMLTGRVPFSADTPVAVLMKHVTEPMPLPAPSEVPEPLVRALLKCTAKKPEDRWPSAGAFVQALELGLGEAQTEPIARVSATSTLSAVQPPRTGAGARTRTVSAPAEPGGSGAARWAAVGVGVACLALLTLFGLGLLLRRAAAPPATAAGSSPVASASVPPRVEPVAPGPIATAIAPVVAPSPAPPIPTTASPATSRQRTPTDAPAMPETRRPAVTVAVAPPVTAPLSLPPAPLPPSMEPPPPVPAASVRLEVDASQDPYGSAAVDKLYLQIRMDGRPVRDLVLSFDTRDAFSRSRKRQQFEVTGIPVGRHRFTLVVSDDAAMGGGSAEGSGEATVEAAGTRLSVQIRERGGGSREIRFR